MFVDVEGDLCVHEIGDARGIHQGFTRTQVEVIVLRIRVGERSVGLDLEQRVAVEFVT